MRSFAVKLQEVELYCGDFSVGLNQAGNGDVVYCDPPYLPLTLTASFTSYQKGDFGLAQQQRLAQACEEAAKRGASVVISNHDTPVARKIYSGADSILGISVQRNISADGRKRGKVGELIAVYLPK